MPCLPIGITVTHGRTSRLKRFLSMPRYFGASRSRSKRGTMKTPPTRSTAGASLFILIFGDRILAMPRARTRNLALLRPKPTRCTAIVVRTYFQAFHNRASPFRYALQSFEFQLTSALPSSSRYCLLAHQNAVRSAAISQLRHLITESA